MSEGTLVNNSVTVLGKIATPLELSHEFYGEKFYKFMLSVERLSDSLDTIPITKTKPAKAILIFLSCSENLLSKVILFLQ